MINLNLRKISICKFTVNKTVFSIPFFELFSIKSWLDLSKEKNGISFQIKIYLCNDSGNKKNRRALAGNALARVQRVHEPTDLWDITLCTRCFETQCSPGCTCTCRSKFLTHSLNHGLLINILCVLVCIVHYCIKIGWLSIFQLTWC